MKIIFLRAYDFPLGGAPQNRLLGICKGLVEQKFLVEVHQYAPSKLNLYQNSLKSQIYKSVLIFNHSWRWSPIKTFLDQVIGLLVGYIISFFSIIQSHRKESIDFIFMNTRTNLYIIPYFFLAKIIGAKLGRDLNEYPEIVLKPERFSNIQKKYRLLTNYKWFDVVFVMTKRLYDYYKPLTKKTTKFLHLPMTVDFERFPSPVELSKQTNLITYIGDLSQSKDGVLNLIKSFSLIKDEFPNIQLQLIGKNNDSSYMKSLQVLIRTLGISKRVLLIGFINPENIPKTLYNSRLLVLSRPNNIQAQGGFPTKLGEYLATGVPVVVTAVGELPDYLTDNVNAFLAKPDDIKSFANTMKRALNNFELSVIVGLTGRKTALKNFSHSIQGQLISEFLKN